MREPDLARWWWSLDCGEKLSMVNGTTAYLLEHGRRNIHDGPDILRAKLLVAGEILTGDVEFHINEGDWFSHKHNVDPRYDRVVLHAVTRSGNRRAITRSGKEVELLEVPPANLDVPESVTCDLRGRGDENAVFEQLQPLARIRWMEKVSRVRHAIRETGPVRTAFYTESFRALGLKGNEESFGRLARCVPLATLSKLHNRREVLSVLAGTAGLVPAGMDPAEEDTKDFGQLWSELASQHGLRAAFMSTEWKRKGIRPSAFPDYRIRFGANIVWALINDWQPWQESFDDAIIGLRRYFGEKSSRKGWQAEWIGNLILPFQAAWSQVTRTWDDDSHFPHWFALDVGYSYGRISRQFSPYLKRRQLTNFGIQQGLLALQDRYCKLGLCQVCPLRN